MPSEKEASPESVNFPLTPCQLMKFNQYYYAIGNDGASNILYENNSSSYQGVNLIEPYSWRYHSFDPAFEKALENCSKQEKPAPLRILCLACGDLRNILYSLAGYDGKKNIEIVVNDYDVHVLARNILLLDSMFDEEHNECTDQAIFSIWFSTGLSTSQHRYLHARLQKLLHESDGPPTSHTSSCLRWQLCEPGLLALLRGVWSKWLGFYGGSKDTSAEDLLYYWSKTQNMRHMTFLKRFLKQTGTGTTTVSRDTLEQDYQQFVNEKLLLATLMKHELHCSPEVYTEEIKGRWRKELSMHLLTGLFQPASDEIVNAGGDLPWHVNPTLFWSEDKYDLHYGTNSFSAFPPFPPKGKSGLIELCYEEFKTWLKGAQTHCSRLSWAFSRADSRTFCVSFDPHMLGWELGSTGSEDHERFGIDELQTGALVCSHGLQKSSHLNSCYGILTKEIPELQRWGVRFFNRSRVVESLSTLPPLPGKPVSVKRSNLKKVVSLGGLLRPSPNFPCFDVITSSNVADHIGMSTLLLLSRPLLLPGGTLLTTCFLHLNHHQSTKDFLEESLLATRSACWTTLFGFRALGYESPSVTSPACQIGHNEHHGVYSSRSNTSFVWIATEFTCNLPLSSDGPLVRALSSFKPRVMDKVNNADGKVALLLSRHLAGSLTEVRIPTATELELMSSLLSCYGNSSANNTPKSDAVEEQVCPDIALCTVQIEDATLRRLFYDEELSLNPTIYVEVKGLRIDGLWVDNTDDGPTSTRFFFYCWRQLLRDSNWTVDLCTRISTLFGIQRRLRSPVIEHCIDERKLGCAIARLRLRETNQMLPRGIVDSPTSASNDVLEKVEISDVVSFQLFDESDDSFEVRVATSRDIFGIASIPSSEGFRISSRDYGTLVVEVRVPYTIQKGQAQHYIFKRDLVFAVPVTSQGWKYQPKTGLLVISKSSHNFFSTSRRVICSNRFCPLNTSGDFFGWSKSSIVFFSGMQLTSSERIRLNQTETLPDTKLPPLLEVKNSLSSLFQIPDILFHVVMKEAGVGCVALIIRHGILLDRKKFAPVLDLSVSWLSHETSLEMANLSLQIRPDGTMRNVVMSCQAYSLFQNICNYYRASTDRSFRVEHPGLKNVVKSVAMRRRFQRVLLTPFFPSAVEQERVCRDALNPNRLERPNKSGA